MNAQQRFARKCLTADAGRTVGPMRRDYRDARNAANGKHGRMAIDTYVARADNCATLIDDLTTKLAMHRAKVLAMPADCAVELGRHWDRAADLMRVERALADALSTFTTDI